MTDQPNTQLYFVVALIAALVLVPVLAPAAMTSPASGAQQSETT